MLEDWNNQDGWGFDILGEVFLMATKSKDLASPE
jgi:hypothetical protein